MDGDAHPYRVVPAQRREAMRNLHGFRIHLTLALFFAWRRVCRDRGATSGLTTENKRLTESVTDADHCADHLEVLRASRPCHRDL